MEFATQATDGVVNAGELREFVRALDQFEVPDSAIVYGETKISMKTPPPIKKLVVKP